MWPFGVTITLLFAAMGLTSCTSGNGGGKAALSSSPAVVMPSENPFMSPTPTRTTPPPGAIGVPMVSGGITLTVLSAADVPSVSMREPGAELGKATGPFRPTAPPPRTRFIAVRTHVVNGTGDGVDFGCSVIVATSVWDDHGNEYNDSGELDVIQGNPPCFVDLPAGGQTDLTFVYNVPAAAHIVAWRFSDFVSHQIPTTVPVDL